MTLKFFTMIHLFTIPNKKKGISKLFIIVLFISLFYNGFNVSAQNAKDSFSADNTELLLKKIATNIKWKYCKGDNFQWAQPNFNDQQWDSAETELDIDVLQKNYFENIGWFRLHLDIDTLLTNKIIAFLITQDGASEIYLNGKLIRSFGKVANNESSEQRFDPQNEPLPVIFNKTTDNIIAVRYSNNMAYPYYKSYGENIVGFQFKIASIDQTIKNKFHSESTYYEYMSFFGFFVGLSLLHLLIFIFYRKQIANLYYSIFVMILALLFLVWTISSTISTPDYTIFINYYFLYLQPVLFLSLYGMIYTLFKEKYSWYFKMCITLFFVFVIIRQLHFHFFNGISGYCASGIITIICFDIGTKVSNAVKQKKDGAWIIATGVMSFLWLLAIMFITSLITGGFNHLDNLFFTVLRIFTILSIPLSMSIYLARDFAKTNKNLSLQLDQIRILSAQTLEQEQEKKRILENQNSLLEQQVQERTLEIVKANEGLKKQNEEISAQRDEIEHQKDLIQEHQKEIVDSINYAKRIQDAILPPIELIKEKLPNSFVFYKPKDIVAGDFYWMEEINDIIFIAAADCTGHGVPGAMVSVVCGNALNRAVKEFGLTETGKILDKITDLVLETFEKSTTDVKDGMDISMLSINRKTKQIQWSGANNPLWYFQNKKLVEITADKQPIGKSDHRKPFTTHNIAFVPNTMFYLFTDGYADQFGGEKGKKFKYKQFQEKLIEALEMKPQDQLENLNSAFENWKGNLEQVDDVTVIGICI